MKGRLSGKTALVTGASRGIGKAIALRFASEGARVGIHYGRSEAAARAVADAIAAMGGSSFVVGAVLGDLKGVETLVAGIPAGERVDILVNNAGQSLPAGLAAGEANFDALVGINMKTPFFVTQALSERISDGGRVINISSGLARLPFPDAIVYSMTKAALNAMTRSHAKALGPRGITVNAVLPGIIRSDMSDWVNAPGGAEAASARSVFDRVGEPADVADIVAFLASDDARWVTGELIDASGGQFLV
ncbi:3-oxoacyl-[acyl-carrier protein] reductase [Kaistia soli DSM 19436]|uniref:3-oxoacyl-[acyl-carrier protein] reductase n=1 Tax=Kaistia soli DSM 19436 TaxID=1122133 RepID=A0A1M4U8Z7_9HYPH|nr:SDR family oxidoreductase [Kaistia soli]SHE53106.1 3-oxoacyl-[acyl-carrier protein] reductase [Kaistia soli DSM 19436]